MAGSGPDGFKAGDPNTPVKGIATTAMATTAMATMAMATMDVLKQASNAGTNMVITYEPTFFGRQENPAAPNDPVYKAKKEFIEKNGLVVFRLRERWQARPLLKTFRFSLCQRRSRSGLK